MRRPRRSPEPTPSTRQLPVEEVVSQREYCVTHGSAVKTRLSSDEIRANQPPGALRDAPLSSGHKMRPAFALASRLQDRAATTDPKSFHRREPDSLSKTSLFSARLATAGTAIRLAISWPDAVAISWPDVGHVVLWDSPLTSLQLAGRRGNSPSSRAPTTNWMVTAERLNR